MSVDSIHPAGDAAFLIEVGGGIDEQTNRRVLALAGWLRRHFEGVADLDVVPAYRSLLISFRPGALGAAAVRRAVDTAPQGELVSSEPSTLVIPVLYGGEFGPDLEFVAGFHRLSPDTVIQLHAAQPYRIYCLGFTPGFPYLAGLPKTLHTPRLPSPRSRVPAGSVALGGEQTGVYPTETPGGWRLIGRTPLILFNPERQPPTDYEPGDSLHFQPISAAEFGRLLPLGLTPADYASEGGQ
jgi:KipI family sensor histidine kinase inhibitor